MPIPNNPIDTPHVDAYSGVTHARDGDFKSYEVDLRIKEAFLKWFLIYFSGDSFDVTDPDTLEVVTETYENCHLMVGEGALPDPLVKPVIHAMPMDDRTKTVGKRGKMKKKTTSIRWNVFLRGTDSLEGLNPKYRGKHLMDLVAAQFTDLFEGTERQGLADRGIKRAEIVRGPIPVQNTHFIIRQFVVSMEADYHKKHNL